LAYRKAALAVTSLKLGLDEDYVQAILADQMDEFGRASKQGREELAELDFASYSRLLAIESIVRYAATASEGLCHAPDSIQATEVVVGETGGLGSVDDANVLSRLEEGLLPLVPLSPVTDGEDALLAAAFNSLRFYYSSVAHRLVREDLLQPILSVAEVLVRGGQVSVADVRSALAGTLQS
jgi:hypothetical protein